MTEVMITAAAAMPATTMKRSASLLSAVFGTSGTFGVSGVAVVVTVAVVVVLVAVEEVAELSVDWVD